MNARRTKYEEDERTHEKPKMKKNRSRVSSSDGRMKKMKLWGQIDNSVPFSQNLATIGEKRNGLARGVSFSSFFTLSCHFHHPNMRENHFSFHFFSYLSNSPNPNDLLGTSSPE